MSGDTHVFDIEANDLLDGVTKVHCLVIYSYMKARTFRFNDQPDSQPTDGRIEDGLRFLAEADVLIGHNVIFYDIPVIRKLYRSWSPKARTIRDTMVMTQLVWGDLMDKDALQRKIPPGLWGNHGLGAWGHRLGILKGTYGETENAWAVWSQEMEDYCHQDVLVNKALWELIKKQKYPELPVEIEHQFAHLMQRQMVNGVGIDVQKVEQLYATICKRRLELETELQEIFPARVQKMKKPEYYVAEGEQFSTKAQARKKFGAKVKIKDGPLRQKHHPFNPSSSDQVADRLMAKYGWTPEEFTPTGRPKVSEEILETLPYPEIKPLVEFIMLVKRAGQIAEGDQAWLKVVKDGRIYGRINTGGAVTRRCTHSKPNLGQVPRVGSPMGQECRALFIPRQGWKMVGWDASGLELRCLAHYMAAYDKGAYGKVILEGDIHTVNQEAAGLPTRDNAKTFIYAFLYGAGDAKIGSIVGGGASEGKRLKNTFFKKIPALKSLTEDVKAAVKKRGWLRGIDGCRLPVRAQHSALNTLLQSAGAIVMKQAAIIQDRYIRTSGLIPGVHYNHVLNVHDEVQIECLPEYADMIGQHGVAAIRSAGKELGFRCPLDGEYKIGNNWAETH